MTTPTPPLSPAAQPGPTDEELIQLAIDTRLHRFQATAGDPIQYEMTEQQVHAFARAVLARYARPTIEPVPVSERPWEREKGWNDPDGECWWCPPDGPPYWQMANPAMVYGGWLLPHHAMPIPTS
jgi:hypothetical protein